MTRASTKWARTWLASVAVGLLIVSCDETSHGCTLVGASSGVRLRGGEDGATVRVCAGTACGTSPLVSGVGFVTLLSLKPGRESELVVTYSSKTHHATSRLKVVPLRFEPNGPDCGPSVAAVTLRFDSTGSAAG